MQTIYGFFFLLYTFLAFFMIYEQIYIGVGEKAVFDQFYWTIRAIYQLFYK